ncbi:MAG: hypothetical protein JXR89_09780 [Deltaproteobacteria bacterium]|nr:hypothetical protein [Deltaproteobacteria bacterium]
MLVALEEISWGQRLLKITTPDYLIHHNLQNEISLHNLDFVQPILHYAYILTGAYGAFAWLAVKIFLPKPKNKGWGIVNFVVPDWFLSPYFFFVFSIYIWLSLVSPSSKGFFRWRDQEPMELLLAMGFLFFTAQNFRKSQKKPERPA